MQVCTFASAIIAMLITSSVYAQVSDDKDLALWEAYYTRSKQDRKAYFKFIKSELKPNQKKLVKPPKAKDFGLDPDKPVSFYKSAEGQRIVDIIISYQTPTGGWSKEVDMTKAKRTPGQGFGEKVKNYVSTYDNDATTTQLKILARAVTAAGKKEYKDAFFKGLDFIFVSQYPNGGWPQSYPLDGKYYDYITYNDKAMVSILELLNAVVEKENDYRFVPEKTRVKAAKALQSGIACILKTQIKVHGDLSVWAAQYNQFMLNPAKARAYEPVSLASQESAEIVLFLMSLKSPSKEVVNAVDKAVAWFETTKISGVKWENGVLSKDASAKRFLWSRFYNIETNKPVFGDRDGKVYFDVSQISEERRLGYGWYKTAPNRILNKYDAWRSLFSR